MLKQRVVTAVIGLAILLALLNYGPSWVMFTLLLAVVCLCTYEAVTMLTPRFESLALGEQPAPGERRPLERWMLVLAVVLAAMLFISLSWAGAETGRAILVLVFIAALFASSFLSSSNDLAVGRVASLLIATSYGALPWLSFWDLYEMGQGPKYVLFVLAVVWSGDTGAYFGGRKFGHRKLAPRMSPNKTVEGALTGLLASVVGGLALNAIYAGSLGGWGKLAFIAVVGGAFGQIGDLVESVLKRFAGVKDSGTLFPGHGGILDRVDGLLFAAPIIWFIFYTL